MKPTNLLKILGVFTLTTTISSVTGISIAQASGFAPPSGSSGSPPRTSGGASRGDSCIQSTPLVTASSSSVKALIPQNNYGITTSIRPTFLVYLPKTEADEVFFSIKDKDKNTLYQMTLPIAQSQEGIIAIQLPEDAPELAVGQDYQWFVTLRCNGKMHPNNPFVDAWIKRVELNVANNQNNLLQQANYLASNGIWYDAAATLASLRQAQPQNQDISSQWQTLLNSVGLEAITNAPVISVR